MNSMSLSIPLRFPYLHAAPAPPPACVGSPGLRNGTAKDANREPRRESGKKLDEEDQELISKVLVGEAGPVSKSMREEPPTRTCHDCGHTAIKNRMSAENT
jgi:hypothetical protein